ncbi:hypothetical protein RFI_34384, partial [Reticulomyxa filosa]
EEIRKLNLKNEKLKVKLQLKDEEIAHLKRHQKENLQLNSAKVCYVLLSIQNIKSKKIIIKQKTTLAEMKKLKDNKIRKKNQKMQVKLNLSMKVESNLSLNFYYLFYYRCNI